MRISSSSPTVGSLLGLQRSQRQCTLPPSMAALASARVLKKRAAHSHLSRRTLSSSFSAIVQLYPLHVVLGCYRRMQLSCTPTRMPANSSDAPIEETRPPYRDRSA